MMTRRTPPEPKDGTATPEFPVPSMGTQDLEQPSYDGESKDDTQKTSRSTITGRSIELSGGGGAQQAVWNTSITVAT